MQQTTIKKSIQFTGPEKELDSVAEPVQELFEQHEPLSPIDDDFTSPMITKTPPPPPDSSPEIDFSDPNSGREVQFYIRPDIEESHPYAHHQYEMISNENTPIEENEVLEPYETMEEDKEEESEAMLSEDLPMRSSLTYNSSSSLMLGKFRPVLPQPEETFNPFVKGPDYAPANIGPSYQCQNLPDVLTRAEQKQQELRNRSLDPVLVFQPPEDPENVYSTPRMHFST